jgi:spermidine/putrescine transport system permease protein
VLKRLRLPTSAQRIRLLLGAWTAGVFAFLYIPILLLIVYSFNSSRQAVVWKGFTLAAYAHVWHDTQLLDASVNSLIIASITTVASVVLGTGGAWLLYRYRFPGLRMINALVAIPLIIPEVVMGVSLLALFIVMRLPIGYTTVIIAHVTFCFPFVMVGVRARLDGLDPSLEEAAQDLGATPWGAFFRVIVPYLMPAIVSGALLAFALSMDEFIVTSFTASPQAYTLPMRIYGRAKRGLDPSLNAISTLFILFTTVLVVLAEGLRRQRSQKIESVL